MEGEEAVGLVRLARSAPLSDGRWWMCSVGIGVSHLKEQKQMVWLEVHRFPDQPLYRKQIKSSN